MFGSSSTTSTRGVSPLIPSVTTSADYSTASRTPWDTAVHERSGPALRAAIVPRAMTALRTCVFPCAGFGTRSFPGTKVSPKEMLRLVDKPIRQYGIEEALGSGLDKLVIVSSKGKDAILDHFDRTSELERSLRDRGKNDLLAEVDAVSRMVDLISVRQKEALGLGHAVLQAKDAVGREPFAVVLPDDVILAETPCLLQMRRGFEETGRPGLPLMGGSSPQTSPLRILAGGRVRPPRLQNPAPGGGAENKPPPHTPPPQR